MRIWLTIPTRNDHPALLADIIHKCGLPKSQIVIVATEPNLDLPKDVWVVHDFGAMNIQRWWNDGIKYAQVNGADFIAVANDDIGLLPGSIEMMAKELQKTNADLCWAANYQTGWLFMLRLASAVRPDERFRWWCGDTDLGQQALRAGGIAHAMTNTQHFHPDEFTHTPEISALIKNDWIEYKKKWEQQ